jgi:hypothetical protein
MKSVYVRQCFPEASMSGVVDMKSDGRLDARELRVAQSRRV